MPYVTYEEYQQAGGKLTEAEFDVQEPRAEVMLDGWTMNRLKEQSVVDDLKAMGDWRSVVIAVCWLTDQMQGIEKARKAKADGAEVTSFNNGVNSFSFGGGSSSDATAAESSAYHEVVRILPVELVSACVSYNNAR
jgi:hypothetical protein|nr:MAG TPA: Head Tail Connector Protein [Caudoviricetes sp.]